MANFRTLRVSWAIEHTKIFWASQVIRGRYETELLAMHPDPCELSSHRKHKPPLCPLVPTLKFEVLPDRYDTIYYAVGDVCFVFEVWT